MFTFNEIDYYPMLKRLASIHSYKYKMQLDECLQNARIAFYNAVNEWDETKKVPFGVFLYSKIHCQTIDDLRQTRKIRNKGKSMELYFYDEIDDKSNNVVTFKKGFICVV